MIEKRRGRKGMVQVIFTLSHETDGGSAFLVGDFNDWSRDATPMEHVKGTFVATLQLPIGARYRFRYLLDGERWENDWAADAYEPNGHGGDDSVVDLTDVVVDDLPAAKRARKPKPDAG